MARRKVIKGVLRNFLDTYMSRYSDYRGYWLFGFLVDDLLEAEVDLLNRGTGERATPLAFAGQLAVTRFEDQLRKARLALSQVRRARLRIRRSYDMTRTMNDSGPPRPGYKLTFQASAVMDNGREYECEQVAIVASHDPLIEHRSGRQSGTEADFIPVQ
jgi:hypothetical protein